MVSLFSTAPSFLPQDVVPLIVDRLLDLASGKVVGRDGVADLVLYSKLEAVLASSSTTATASSGSLSPFLKLHPSPFSVLRKLAALSHKSPQARAVLVRLLCLEYDLSSADTDLALLQVTSFQNSHAQEGEERGALAHLKNLKTRGVPFFSSREENGNIIWSGSGGDGSFGVPLEKHHLCLLGELAGELGDLLVADAPVDPKIELGFLSDLRQCLKDPQCRSFRSLALLKQSESTRERGWGLEKNNGTSTSSSSSLVLTPTTEENLNKVLDVIVDPTPVLLEGPTGVGKSATITAAAKMRGFELIRFNMSSTVGVDDLLGKLQLNPRGGLEYVEQPFTIAYEKGKWLLLDEVNLAEDRVLQCIENALDQGHMLLQTGLSANIQQKDEEETPGEEGGGSVQETAEGTRVVKKHPNFRLFATQNPATGLFKGKRERLSSAFLDRFLPVIFNPLPREEWVDVVVRRFCQKSSMFDPTSAQPVADLLVGFHEALVKRVSQLDFIEPGSHAHFTIRDLLKLTSHIMLYGDSNTNQKQFWENQNTILLNEIWCVYGERFATELAQQEVLQILRSFSLPKWEKSPFPELKSPTHWKIVSCGLGESFLELSQANMPPLSLVLSHGISTTQAQSLLDSLLLVKKSKKSLSEMHCKVCQLFFEEKVISKVGLYVGASGWFVDFLQRLHKIPGALSTPNLATLAAMVYGEKIRHEWLRQEVFEIISSEFQSPKELFLEGLCFERSTPDRPFLVSERVVAIWRLLMRSLQVRQPILLVGESMSGKDATLEAFGLLLGKPIHQVDITPETEAASLIGQLFPAASGGSGHQTKKQIEWEDGPVTKSFLNGEWVLLDNLEQADATVLERLNPMLEEPPVLLLSEKGDNEEILCRDGFRVLSTLTPAATQIDRRGITGLSPALANRFTIIHLPSFDKDPVAEVTALIPVYLDIGSVPPEEVECVYSASAFLVKEREALGLRFGDFARLYNSTFYLLQANQPVSSLPSAFYWALQVCVFGKLSEERGELRNQVQKSILGVLAGSPRFVAKREICLVEGKSLSTDHILTESREAIAEKIIGGVDCNLPILLEGPAAVGKTSIIAALAKEKYKIKLERVNNTDTTTLQDYYGSYLPSDSGFVFHNGALVDAMKDGHWFLADEFDLAEPAVLNSLFPILEGKQMIDIPGAARKVRIHPNFRFFATQNGVKYANRHKLPETLRRRFIEVQFCDFPPDELASIIAQRKDPKLSKQIVTKAVAQNLAQTYGELGNITMREIIKWVRRMNQFLKKNSSATWANAGFSLLGPRNSFSSKEGVVVREKLSQVWRESLGESPLVEIVQKGGNVLFFEGSLSVSFEGKLGNSSLFVKRSPPILFQRALVRVAFAVANGEPVLVVGPSSFKTKVFFFFSFCIFFCIFFWCFFFFSFFFFSFFFFLFSFFPFFVETLSPPFFSQFSFSSLKLSSKSPKMCRSQGYF